MSHPKKTENYTIQASVNSPLGKALIVNEYFMGSTTMSFVRLPWGLTSISNQLTQMKSLFMGWHASLLSIESVRALAKLADDVALVDARLRLAAGSVQQFAQAQQFAYQLAARTGASYESIATLYSRLSLAGSSLGLSQARVAEVATVTAQALRVSGASASETKDVIIQLSQALGSGVLRGDEFNTIMEQGGRLAQALADGLGLPIGRLRALAEQGLLTTDVVVKALATQRQQVEAEAAAMPRTIAQAVTGVNDAFGRMLTRLNDTTGATRSVAQAFNGLASHIEPVAGAAAVAGMGALGVALARLASGAVQATAAFAARTMAAREAMATDVAHRQVVVSFAQAELVAAQATVARATGMARLAAVEQVLVPAQARMAAAQAAHTAALSASGIAATGLRGALSFLGGPLGIVLGLLTAGATAWAVWGNSATTAGNQAKSAADKAADALQRAREVSARMAHERQFGTGDAATLREAIKTLEEKQKNWQVIVQGNKSPAFQKNLNDTMQELAARRGELAQMEASGAAGAPVGGTPGAPTEIGRALLKKGWDAYVKQYNEGADKLNEAVRELKVKAKEYGIAESSPEFAAALKKLQANLGKYAVVTRMPELRAQFDAALALTKAAAEDEAAVLEASLKGRLVTEGDYWATRQALQQEGFARDRQALQQRLGEQQALLQRLQGVRPKDANQRDELAQKLREARDKVAELDTELKALDGREVTARFTLAVDRQQAQRELADALAGAAEELARLTGTDTPELRRAAVERSFRDLSARMAGDAAAANVISRLIDVKVASAELDALEGRWQRAVAQMRATEESANIQQQQGLLSSGQAQAAIAAAHVQSAQALAQLLPSMTAAAQAIGPDAVARVQAWKNELATVKQVVDPVASALDTDFKNGFAAMFEQIGSGAKSAKEAFADFARGVVASIARIASQKLAESLFGSMFGATGAGGSGGFGAFVSSLFKGFATGGLVSGPGTGTSDSIPARLSAGEYVVRASAVQRLGVSFLDSINGFPGAHRAVSGRLAFAAGGLVPDVAAANPAAGVGAAPVRIVNVIDPAMAADYLNSSAGERTILNVLARNGQAVREVLR